MRQKQPSGDQQPAWSGVGSDRQSVNPKYAPRYEEPDSFDGFIAREHLWVRQSGAG
jgi:hypothetical protein